MIGRTRDFDAEALVAGVRASGEPPSWQRGVAGARAYHRERAARSPEGPPVDHVEDVRIALDGHSIDARIYRPAALDGLPLVVYFHGGGYVLGGIESSDAFARRVVNAVACVLISVAYRLAPEHPFPAGITDAVGAIEWAAERAAEWGGDPARVIVLGDSAGGGIATVAVLRLLAPNEVLVARQVLAYPSVAANREPAPDGLGAEWPLTDEDRFWFLDQYLTDETQQSDPNVTPLLADVTGLPPTTILVGGCDPLEREGRAYAEHLANAGVSVDLHLYTGQIHGFLTMDESILPRSREALDVVATAIRNTRPR